MPDTADEFKNFENLVNGLVQIPSAAPVPIELKIGLLRGKGAPDGLRLQVLHFFLEGLLMERVCRMKRFPQRFGERLANRINWIWLVE